MSLILLIIVTLLSEHRFALSDECPPGWSRFNSSCYRGFSSPDRILSYTEAQEQCREAQAGSQLPSVHSLAETNFIVELGKSQGWFGPKKGVYLDRDRVYSISVPGDVLENVGVILLSFIISIIFIVVSVLFFLQFFTCNVNLDCYRRRSHTEPYSISLSISEDALVERRK